MNVRFTARARRRALLASAWWRTNRPTASALFDEQLKAATEALSEQPALGMVYAEVRGKTVRRLLLPRIEQHLYYVVDEDAGVVVVHTLWGATRGRPPKL